ncbi:hypothetical protein M446_2723 [Methylobacterium sp. 4-46]|uniref:hypothetical protein n=1 Tax=unclassified Methylobacterium TaxID=2615210 RepID=UPI000165C79B|nr:MULTISPECIES: hypothetical protein [Methylobacterium]ACA17162.1 hypothetical protein M446_2723 [Methylobacterium sp. 4-46]WFT82846.1 hypothetical protein QA634_13800 [Methylobacterium nodulans]
MLGYREIDDPAPPPAAERVRREPATLPEGERLERLLAGLVVTRPSDDTVCPALLKRNLVVTQLAA